MVNGPDAIYVERARPGGAARRPFAADEQLLQTIDRIVSAVNRRVDESNPMVDARLPVRRARQRHHPAAVADRPALTIRRFPRAYALHELSASAPSTSTC